MIDENGVTRLRKYSELTHAEAIQANCDVKETNIILQDLPPEKRECKLYDEFNKFSYKKGETLRDFYLRFSLLLNDMNIYNVKPKQFQVNTKFLNTLPPEWSKFVTDVKLVRELHTTNIDQLYAYLGQHEFHAIEVRLMQECNLDPLALVATHQMTQLRFVLDCVLSSTAFCLFEDHLLGSRDRPPILAIGRYPQWRSWFLRYIDTRPNDEALRKCILSGPSKPTTVLVQAMDATDDSPAVPEHTTVEIPMNMSLENKAYFLAETEAIHLILTGIGDEIYSTVDACQTAQEMWEAIKRLQQEWSRFVTTVKQQHKLDEVSYHKLFDILKQYQNKVNELHAERLARNPNPLALVATAQADRDPYYQTSRSHRSSAPSPKPSIPSRSHTSTRHKGKEIAKPITPPSETASKEDNDPEEAQRDKDMQKNLALIAKYFKKIYKPTNNNLRTSSNSKNKNVDTTLRYKNDDHSGQFGTHRIVNVAGTREKVGSPLVQKSGIQCFNCKEYGHFAKDFRKPKRVKDSTYHKEKMLMCKQAEQGVPLQAEHYMAKIQEVPTADSGTNSKPVEQVQNDAGYNVFANDLQHYKQSESVSNTCLVETDDSNVIPDSPDMCEDDIQNEQNDIQKQLKKANTTLAQELKECKSILAETSKSLGESISVRDSFLVGLQTKQTEFEKYKAFNDRTVDYDKLKRKLNEALGQLAHKDTVIRKGLKTKACELSVVKEKHDELMKQSLLTKSHYEGLVKQKTKVITDLKLREEHDIEKILSMEKQLKFLNKVVYKRSQSIQTIHMMAPKVSTYNGRPTFAILKYLKQAQSKIPCLYVFPYDQYTYVNRLIPDREETLALERESRSKLNKDLVRPYDYTNLNSLYEISNP
nr:hypothetical protein [Tanacetum cinerariifolium]